MVPKRVEGLVDAWAEEACDLYDLQLFDVVVSKGWLIRVYVDGKDNEKGVDVASCVKVSRYVEALLDEDETLYDGYNLEVSSPGIERKLSKAKHYKLSMGKDVKIVVKDAINDQSVFNGRIENFEDDIIEVLTEKGSIKIPFPNVTKAKLTFKF